MPDISKITLPSGNTYDIKDAVARELIAGGVTFIISNSAENTPQGITWKRDSETITGTLAPAAAQKGAFYMVPSTQSATGDADIYDEYAVIDTSGTKSWEKIGNTRINLDNLKALAYKDSVNVVINPTTTTVKSMSEAGSVSGGSAAEFTQGQDSFSFTANTPTSIDVTKFSGGSFTQGIDQFTATVLDETLTLGFTQGTDSYAAAALNTGFYSAGSAAEASFTQGEDSFTSNTPTSVTLPNFEDKTVWNGYSSAIGS